MAVMKRKITTKKNGQPFSTSLPRLSLLQDNLITINSYNCKVYTHKATPAYRNEYALNSSVSLASLLTLQKNIQYFHI